MGFKRASRFFGIPRSTLHDKVGGDHPLKRGGQRVFSDQEEANFCDMIEAFVKKQLSFTDHEFLKIVNKYFVRRSAARRETRRPRLGKGFLAAFRKRHPRAAVALVPEAVERKLDGASRAEAHAFYNRMQRHYDEYGFHDAPHRVFNVDESGVQSGAVKGRVLAPRGCRNVSTIAGGNLRINYTVVACVSAAGVALLPYVLFKSLGNIYHSWVHGGPPGTRYDATPNGWIDAESFLRVRYNDVNVVSVILVVG
jgi:hypothetical protein